MLKEMKVDPRQHPVLLTEPVHNTEPIREQMLQTMFEGHQVTPPYPHHTTPQRSAAQRSAAKPGLFYVFVCKIIIFRYTSHANRLRM